MADLDRIEDLDLAADREDFLYGELTVGKCEVFGCDSPATEELDGTQLCHDCAREIEATMEGR